MKDFDERVLNELMNSKCKIINFKIFIQKQIGHII